VETEEGVVGKAKMCESESVSVPLPFGGAALIICFFAITLRASFLEATRRLEQASQFFFLKVHSFGSHIFAGFPALAFSPANLAGQVVGLVLVWHHRALSA